jgi:hypothetical protein
VSAEFCVPIGVDVGITLVKDIAVVTETLMCVLLKVLLDKVFDGTIFNHSVFLVITNDGLYQIQCLPSPKKMAASLENLGVYRDHFVVAVPWQIC